jgi:hypothetical protein
MTWNKENFEELDELSEVSEAEAGEKSGPVDKPFDANPEQTMSLRTLRKKPHYRLAIPFGVTLVGWVVWSNFRDLPRESWIYFILWGMVLIFVLAMIAPNIMETREDDDE